MRMSDKVAIIRVRGIRRLKPKIKKTLELLMLHKPNHCVLVNNSPEVGGMIRIVKDYVGYGTVTVEAVYKLLRKRGEKGGKMLKELSNDAELRKMAEQICQGEPVKKYADPVFRLHPPRSGRKNIKRAYPMGELGRRTDMDELLKRMM